MTPTDPTGETPPARAATLAITMALGALAASCYASYRRRTHGDADPSIAPAAADAGTPQRSTPPRPAGNATAPRKPFAEPEAGAARDGRSP